MSDTTVYTAWAAVMADVRALAKTGRNNEQNYNFRGIDAVMDAVGPILREHRVAVVPTSVTASHRDVQTSRGKPSREATVVVSYAIIGPEGDRIDGMAPGEAMDFGDKGTPKAMSVALRTFLLQALCLPTQDTDPDAQSYERDNAPPPAPPVDPLTQARAVVADTWRAQVGPLDTDEQRKQVTEQYEQWKAQPWSEATPADLHAFAEHLKEANG